MENFTGASPAMTGLSGMSGMVGGGTISIASLKASGLQLLDMDADFNVLTGGARQFYTADLTSLEISDNAGLSTGDINFTIAAWVYCDNTGAMTFVSKFGNDGNREYRFSRNTDNTVFLGVTAAGSSEISVSSVATVNTNTWAFVIATHDAANNLLIVYVNDNAGTSTAHSTGVFDGIANFSIGSLSRTDAVTRHFNGRISRVGFWKRTLTSLERTWLYNLGNGRSYGELGVAATDGSALTTSLISYWNLNETSGAATAIDAHGTNDLIPTFGELISNPGFETAGGGGADIFGSWTEYNGGTGTVSDELVIINAGAHAVRLIGLDASNYAGVYQQILTATHQYTYSFRARNAVTGNMAVYVGDTNLISVTLNTNYTTYSGTTTCSGVGRFYLDESTNATAYIDTVSVKAVNIPAADGPGTSGTAVDGDPIAQWTSTDTIPRAFIQATAAKRPILATAGINSKAAIQFDGVDDLLVINSAFLTGLSGAVFVLYQLDGIPDSYQALLSSSDEALDTKDIIFHGRGNSANAHLNIEQRNADTPDLLDGNTAVANATKYISTYISNSTTARSRLNGLEQTITADTGANSGDWWDDATAKDNVVIGAVKRTAEAVFLIGRIRRILVYTELSAAQITAVEAELALDAGITL